MRYTSGDRTATITIMVVRAPTYTVEIEHAGDIGFQWEGIVDQNGNVVETTFTLAQ